MDNFLPSLLRCENFRIERDGTLKKRNGFAKICDLPQTPISFSLMGNEMSDGVCFPGDHAVYFVTLDPISCGILGDEEQEINSSVAKVLPYGNTHLLFDGVYPKVYARGRFENVSGYVPLCAKDWDVNSVGEINEDLNLLSDHYRATYKIPKNYSSFLINLPFYAEEVDFLTVDGVLIDPEEYSFLRNRSSVLCDFLKRIDFGDDEFKTVTVYASTPPYDADPLFRTRKAFLASDGSVIAYDARGEGNDCLVFRSDVSQKRTNDSISVNLYEANSDLYFPENGSRYSSPNGDTVTSVVQLDEKIFFFTDSECLCFDEAHKAPISVSCDFGSASEALVCNSQIFTVCRNGFYLWDIPSDVSERKVKRLSFPFDVDFDWDFCKNVCLLYDPVRNEVYVFLKKLGGAFVYSFERDAFTLFSGFFADLAFFFCGRVYFSKGPELFAFLDEYVDRPSEDEDLTITSSFTLRPIDFGEAFKKKKCVSCALSVTSKQILCGLCVELDDGHTFSASASQKGGKLPSVIVKKMPPYRFYSASFSVTDRSRGELSVHCLSFEGRACE